MNCRPSLVDVAVRARCSKSTVSLALRNDPRISQETRDRVLACARELNYRPDPALAYIAAHRWRSCTAPSGSVVAFVTTNHPNGIFLDGDALRGARQQAESFGYRLDHFRTEEYREPAHLGRVMQHRGIRGIIVGQLMREDFLAKFPWQDFCGVACNTGFYKPPLHLVMPDHSHTVKRAFNEALKRGYRRVGMVLFDEPNAIDDFDKVSAFLYCQSLLPTDAVRIPVAHVEPVQGNRLTAWLDEYQPDCVLGLNDAVFWAILRSGRRIPDELGFVSLMAPLEANSSKRLNAEANPTTLDHCAELLGRTALEQLDIQLRTNQSGIPAQPITMMVEARWVEGSSLPDRKQSAVTESETAGGVVVA